jgi:multidrug efflux pump subunit AcrB
VRGVRAGGLSVRHFRAVLPQFAVTIAASTVISCFVSLTLSPALCAVLFKPHDARAAGAAAGTACSMGAFFGGFNRGFEWLSTAMAADGAAGAALGAGAGGLCRADRLAGFQFARAPTGFIPEQDQGYLITVLQLPPGATLARTERSCAGDRHHPHALRASSMPCRSRAWMPPRSPTPPIPDDLFRPAVALQSREGRDGGDGAGRSAPRLSVIQGAYVLTIPPPPVQGIGSAGGFKMMLQDRAGSAPRRWKRPPRRWSPPPTRTPPSPASSRCSTRVRPRSMPISTAEGREGRPDADRRVQALQVYLGSQYVNDFNYLGRTYQVIAQADGRSAARSPGHARLKVRNASRRDGADRHGGELEGHHRALSRAALRSVPGGRGAGRGRARRRHRHGAAPDGRTGAQVLPPGIGFEWTELAFQQQQKGTPTLLVFGAAALFVFLVLAANMRAGSCRWRWC